MRATNLNHYSFIGDVGVLWARKSPSKEFGVVLFDVEDLEKINSLTWHIAESTGYVYSGKISGKSKALHRKIVQTNSHKDQIDHINGDKLDNRKSNLRVCSNQQNSCNRGPQKNNTTGFKGVFYHTKSKKFHAYIKVNGIKKHLGIFDTALEASKVRDLAALKLHGKFAWVH